MKWMWFGAFLLTTMLYGSAKIQIKDAEARAAAAEAWAAAVEAEAAQWVAEVGMGKDLENETENGR